MEHTSMGGAELDASRLSRGRTSVGSRNAAGDETGETEPGTGRDTGTPIDPSASGV